MRNLIIISLLILLYTSIQSQAPNAFNYQGKANLSNGDVLSDRSISLRISILAGQASGNEVFAETHNVQTSSSGVFTLRIGEGQNERGKLSNVSWGSNQYFIKTEIDPNGENAFTELGTTQLYSVPYALYAAEAGNAAGGEGGGSDNQTLSFAGTTLSIQNGNSVNLSSLRDGVNDADSDPDNEIQELSISGNTLSISNGNSINLPSSGGGGNNTDNQTLSLSSKTLSISGGNSVNLSSISNDADADPDNEIQRLSISGDRLSISGGNTINLPTSGGGGSSPWQIDGDEITYSGDQILFENSNSIAISLSKFDNGSGFLNMSGDSDVGSLSISAFTGYQARDENDEVTHFFADFQGEGYIQAHNKGTAVVDLGSNAEGNGAVYTSNEDGSPLIDITSTASSNEGDILLYSNEKQALRLAAFEDGTGFFSINGDNENEIARMSKNTAGAGNIIINGPNGNANARVTSLSTNEYNGFIEVYDEDGDSQAGIYIDANGMGRVFGDMKNFRTQHPNKEEFDIVYASIEGPEAAIFCRGTSKLIKGKAEVELPEHFSLLAVEESMTIMLTPGSAESKGLAATDKKSTNVTIEELGNGNGNYSFDWEVKAVRKGFENYKVLMHKSTLKSMVEKSSSAPLKISKKRKRHAIK